MVHVTHVCLTAPGEAEAVGERSGARRPLPAPPDVRLLRHRRHVATAVPARGLLRV